MARNDSESRLREHFGRAVTLGWLSLTFGVFAPFASALADKSWTCGLRDQTIECHYDAPEADDSSLLLASKMIRAMESLQRAMPACSVTFINSSGQTVADKPQMIAFVKISEESQCSVNKYHETSYAHVSLDCSQYLFKYSARGVDIFADGTKSHWDTLTQRLPWRSISDDPHPPPPFYGYKLQILFGALCR